MAAYAILDFVMREPALMRDYIERVPAIIRQFGGRYLARGGKVETIEGDWHPDRIVLLEFPSSEQAKRFYDSEEYKEFKAVRHKAGTSKLIIVEGLERPLRAEGTPAGKAVK
jgi:uncharacterized protein (DUF1330 family)